MDPRVEALMAQGYPEDVAKQMVASGADAQMSNPFPWLGTLNALNSATGGINPSAPLTLNATGNGTATTPVTGTTDGITPEIQALLDEGYNLAEAKQILEQRAAKASGETFTLGDKNTNGKEIADPYALSNMFANAGAGIGLDQAAFGLGRAIGSEKGTNKTLNIIGNAGKLTLGLTRGVASGLGQMKASQYAQDEYERKIQEGTGRTTYTPAPQYDNTNYTGGNSYGEEGGVMGKTLPLKEFFKNGGFKKPGFKKLM